MTFARKHGSRLAPSGSDPRPDLRDSPAPTDSRILGVIPARLGSSRLPRKPLHLLLDRPLIEWVWDRVMAMSSLDEVVVATDHRDVVRACRDMGATVVLTDPDHPSGTDRVAQVAARSEYADCDIVVNIQGDEPLLEERHVEAAVALVRDHGWDVGTCATPVRDLSEWRDPAAVKVVRRADGGALYFSRAPVPAARDADPTPDDFDVDSPCDATFLRHVGLYVYRREALARWVKLPTGDLERWERLEQLRPLAAGMQIGVSVVESAAPGVDTPEDAARMEARLRDLTLHRA